ncbi:hypothetical protein B0H10DRAFT_2325592 [Mycena sp. CBHHK59/15]|nr:hypothetical protein B0H10DRAFT_2325592 [Mycena sp. CBHHK59/15]
MTATVGDLILILQLFFPGEISLHKALYVFGVIIYLYPLLRLPLNQQNQPRQPSRTAWNKSILRLLVAAFKQEDDYPPIWASRPDRGQEYADHISDELAPVYAMLGLDPDDLSAPSPNSLFPAPRIILCTSCISVQWGTSILSQPCDDVLTPRLSGFWTRHFIGQKRIYLSLTAPPAERTTSLIASHTKILTIHASKDLRCQQI